MTPDEITKALRERGYSQTIIAAALNPPVTQTTITSTIHRRGGSKRAALAIAKILDKPVSEVFDDKPEWSENYPTLAFKNKQQREQKIQELSELLAS